MHALKNMSKPAQIFLLLAKAQSNATGRAILKLAAAVVAYLQGGK